MAHRCQGFSLIGKVYSACKGGTAQHNSKAYPEREIELFIQKNKGVIATYMYGLYMM